MNLWSWSVMETILSSHIAFVETRESIAARRNSFMVVIPVFLKVSGNTKAHSESFRARQIAIVDGARGMRRIAGPGKLGFHAQYRAKRMSDILDGRAGKISILGIGRRPAKD